METTTVRRRLVDEDGFFEYDVNQGPEVRSRNFGRLAIKAWLENATTPDIENDGTSDRYRAVLGGI